MELGREQSKDLSPALSSPLIPTQVALTLKEEGGSFILNIFMDHGIIRSSILIISSSEGSSSN